jgi:CBS domain-containing protein
MENKQMGMLDQRFLARSIGLLPPPDPIVVYETDSINKAVVHLQKEKHGAVLVVDRNDIVTGIFTERDAVLKVLGKDASFLEEPIANVMTKNPQSCQMTTTVAFALTMMSKGGYRHIPVVDEGNHPVGILTVKMIIDFLVQSISHDVQSFGRG